MPLQGWTLRVVRVPENTTVSCNRIDWQARILTVTDAGTAEEVAERVWLYADYITSRSRASSRRVPLVGDVD